ncbi:uncharacterized protein LOC127627191 [Xyrauchen texanus]|uniref:uncharacterized protein LOC127627191 n=1 Tax=Xyrauchen texanus TaxID=154827 RepID=UPI002241B14A|nr:uncharacterized protein LOC127627191 [Xyrauchen texanus]
MALLQVRQGDTIRDFAWQLTTVRKQMVAIQHILPQCSSRPHNLSARHQGHPPAEKQRKLMPPISRPAAKNPREASNNPGIREHALWELEEADPALELPCPVRAILGLHVEFARSEQLFVCIGGLRKRSAVTKQRKAHWVIDVISMAYYKFYPLAKHCLQLQVVLQSAPSPEHLIVEMHQDDQAPSVHCPSAGTGSGGSAGTMHFTRTKAQRGNTKGKEEVVSIHTKSVSRMDSLKPVKQHILWEKKAEMLQSRVNELEEENDFLKRQLEEKSAQEQGGNLEIMATGDEEARAMILDSSTDTTTDSNTDSNTDSSSSSISDSSDEGKKKKKRKKKNGKKKSKKRKKETKKVKRSNGKGERVASIADVVKRYRRVLKLVQRGFRMTAAFKKACVSTNAVKDTAAIAEIYMVDKSVLEQFKGKYTLLQLAQLCQKKIVGELAEKIIEMKNNKQLIPFSVKKD